jgi:hypothetical protein
MKYIGSGSSGVVYAHKQFAIKIGDIEYKEIQRQRYFAHKGLALPIIYYRKNGKIPVYIARDICYTHGRRNDFHNTYACNCSSNRADILITPLIIPVTEETEETLAFAEYLHNEAIQAFGYGRDRRVVNLGIYNGRLVGLDWG